MRLLLDTNVLLWWLDDPRQVAEPARSAIEDGAVEVSVSAATAFEICTKVAIGKLEFDGEVSEEIDREGFAELPVTVAHAVTAGALPLIHRDPFDRLLLGQALSERMTVATRDVTFARYGVPVLVA